MAAAPPGGAAAAAAKATRPAQHQPPPLPLQLRMLFKRSWKQVTRDKAALRLRVATNIQSGIVFGSIWWRLRKLQASIKSRIGLLQACPDPPLSPPSPPPPPPPRPSPQHHPVSEFHHERTLPCSEETQHPTIPVARGGRRNGVLW